MGLFNVFPNQSTNQFNLSPEQNGKLEVKAKKGSTKQSTAHMSTLLSMAERPSRPEACVSPALYPTVNLALEFCFLLISFVVIAEEGRKNKEVYHY